MGKLKSIFLLRTTGHPQRSDRSHTFVSLAVCTAHFILNTELFYTCILFKYAGGIYRYIIYTGILFKYTGILNTERPLC